MQTDQRPVAIGWLELRRQRKRLTPAQLIAVSFALAIVIGTTLLALPIAHAPGQRVGILDAFFTATSAVCVTGRIVVDTGSAFNDFGKTVILLLIQAGGLGIMTLGTVVALAAGRRIGFRERMNLQAQMNAAAVGGVVDLMRRILLLVFTIEVLGALALYWRFRTLEGPVRGAFMRSFTASVRSTMRALPSMPTASLPLWRTPLSTAA